MQRQDHVGVVGMIGLGRTGLPLALNLRERGRGGRAARAEPARGRRERERHPVTPVAGIVSQSFLTPLSHVNLRAAGWDIPNVALKDAATKFATLDGKLVLFEAGATSASLRAATPVEIANAKKAIRARCTPPTRARMAARPRISERS